MVALVLVLHLQVDMGISRFTQKLFSLHSEKEIRLHTISCVRVAAVVSRTPKVLQL